MEDKFRTVVNGKSIGLKEHILNGNKSIFRAELTKKLEGGEISYRERTVLLHFYEAIVAVNLDNEAAYKLIKKNKEAIKKNINIPLPDGYSFLSLALEKYGGENKDAVEAKIDLAIELLNLGAKANKPFGFPKKTELIAAINLLPNCNDASEIPRGNHINLMSLLLNENKGRARPGVVDFYKEDAAFKLASRLDDVGELLAEQGKNALDQGMIRYLSIIKSSLAMLQKAGADLISSTCPITLETASDKINRFNDFMLERFGKPKLGDASLLKLPASFNEAKEVRSKIKAFDHTSIVDSVQHLVSKSGVIDTPEQGSLLNDGLKKLAEWKKHAPAENYARFSEYRMDFYNQFFKPLANIVAEVDRYFKEITPDTSIRIESLKKLSVEEASKWLKAEEMHDEQVLKIKDRLRSELAGAFGHLSGLFRKDDVSIARYLPSLGGGNNNSAIAKKIEEAAAFLSAPEIHITASSLGYTLAHQKDLKLEQSHSIEDKVLEVRMLDTFKSMANNYRLFVSTFNSFKNYNNLLLEADKKVAQDTKEKIKKAGDTANDKEVTKTPEDDLRKPRRAPFNEKTTKMLTGHLEKTGGTTFNEKALRQAFRAYKYFRNSFNDFMMDVHGGNISLSGDEVSALRKSLKDIPNACRSMEEALALLGVESNKKGSNRGK